MAFCFVSCDANRLPGVGNQPFFPKNSSSFSDAYLYRVTKRELLEMPAEFSIAEFDLNENVFVDVLGCQEQP